MTKMSVLVCGRKICQPATSDFFDAHNQRRRPWFSGLGLNPGLARWGPLIDEDGVRQELADDTMLEHNKHADKRSPVGGRKHGGILMLLNTDLW